MGILRQHSTGAACGLEPEHIVGRSGLCALCIDETYVSQHHAALRWSGVRWELKDLGSLNGTFINGVPVRVGVANGLTRGDRIAFGHLQQSWELSDDGRPCTMLVPLDAGCEPIPIVGELALVPSEEDAAAMVLRGANGAWRIEQRGSVLDLSNRCVVHVAGRPFRFCCADAVARTSTEDIGGRTSRRLAQVHLLFRVSADEEHVELRAAFGNQVHDLGSRSHNYPLLLLARQRLADVVEGHAASACGWVYQDTFADQLRVSPSLLTIHIYRIRQRFEMLGMTDFADVVERRPKTKQLRIGVPSLSIQPI